MVTQYVNPGKGHIFHIAVAIDISHARILINRVILLKLSPCLCWNYCVYIRNYFWGSMLQIYHFYTVENRVIRLLLIVGILGYFNPKKFSVNFWRSLQRFVLQQFHLPSKFIFKYFKSDIKSVFFCPVSYILPIYEKFILRILVIIIK